MSLIKNVLVSLRDGDINEAYKHKEELNDMAQLLLLGDYTLSPEQIEELKDLLSICNITYNDTDRELLPIEDGVYDLLLEKYKKYDPNFQVGAEVIQFDPSISQLIEKDRMVEAVTFMTDDEIDLINKSYFYQDIAYPDPHIDERDVYAKLNAIPPIEAEYISKRKHDTTHAHPELVGTLDKCKFVYVREAAERGADQDPNVTILERDFFGAHIAKGIIDPRKRYMLLLELKYDGVSVEADCTDQVEFARSRGDTGIGQASDMTPILKGYRFPHRKPGSPMVGVKFEAIMTKYDLQKFNELKGYQYKNCRSAIVGLLGSSDSWKYRDLITLVPLQLDNETFKGPEIWGNPIAEVEYMNDQFVSHGCPMRYVTIAGNVKELLYQIHLFQQESEFARSVIPFMYDGIVIHYIDPEIREALGRENFINKYSVALKFNPLKKSTIFRNYTFTVGQDGSITPMIHYDPVEFYGTIHPKSSGHSYKRFMELELHPGDMIDVEYVNDVMPYVSKPDNDFNDQNELKSPLIEFPTRCPVCGGEIVVSDSGKSAKCTNFHCGGRSLARMVNMCAKLNMNGFGESTIAKLGVIHLKDLMILCYDPNWELRLNSLGFGPVEALNIHNECARIMENELPETVLLGSIGFTGISTKTFELILSNMSYNQFRNGIMMKGDELFVDKINSIKGIGSATVNTIISEFMYFYDDIEYMYAHANIKPFLPSFGKKIRATGFRDKEFFAYLRSLGLDADDNASVTKDTDILLIPMNGHDSAKVRKAQQYGIPVLSVQEFKDNIKKYIP